MPSLPFEKGAFLNFLVAFPGVRLISAFIWIQSSIDIYIFLKFRPLNFFQEILMFVLRGFVSKRACVCWEGRAVSRRKPGSCLELPEETLWYFFVALPNDWSEERGKSAERRSSNPTSVRWAAISSLEKVCLNCKYFHLELCSAAAKISNEVKPDLQITELLTEAKKKLS